MRSLLSILLFAVVATIIVFNEDKPHHNQFGCDAGGYYLYLPAVFIYHDLTTLSFYHEVDSAYPNSLGLDPSLHHINGNVLNKYPVGVALLESPLFLIANWYAHTHPVRADGFSVPYQLAGIFSNIVFVVLGLFILRNYLRKTYTDGVVAYTLLCIAFGTNLYTYTAFNVGMSHPYSFFLFSCLLALTHKWYERDSPKMQHSILLGLTLGLIVIVRPLNIIAFLVPLLWRLHDVPSFNKRLQFLAHNGRSMAIVLLCLTAVIAIQLVYWKAITGSYLFYTYTGERFDFSHPHIMQGLFSYRKGWFVYTPIALISLCGFYFLWKKDKAIVPMLSLFFLLMIYCVFSWHEWWYGGSFGARPLIETYAFIALLIAPTAECFFSSASKVTPIIYTTVISMLIVLNLFQSYQYSMGLIHWSRMTGAYYWKVFGRVQFDRAANEKYLLPEDYPDEATEPAAKP